MEEKATFKEAVTATGGAIVPLMLPVIILGGIIGGAATPTEISVIAVLYAFILGKYGYGEIKWSDMIPILLRSSIMTGSVMFLVGTASILSWILSIAQVPQMVGQLIIHLSSSPLVFLLLCNLTFILIGCILEGLPAMLILVPIFLPLCAQFGVSQLHFGILVIASLGLDCSCHRSAWGCTSPAPSPSWTSGNQSCHSCRISFVCSSGFSSLRHSPGLRWSCQVSSLIEPD